MRISFAPAQPEGAYSIALAVSSAAAIAERPSVDPAAATLARSAAEAQRFEGEAGTLAELFVPTDDAARRLLIVGVGSNAATEGYEKAGAALAAKLLTSGETRLVVDVSSLAPTERERAAAHIALGLTLRAWRIDTYRTKLPAKSRPSLIEAIIVGGGDGAETAWARLSSVAEGIAFARELVSEPGNIIYPESFVERASQLADLGVRIDVLDQDAMRGLGMGALLGVAQGSARPPRLLVMRWEGAEGDPVAFVGKGVTFDSGGISIKPAGGMEDMKWDMGGAAAVAGVMKTLALRKAKAHVIGVCGLVENMPDGNAQRPGDIVTSMSGQTIEVINTDAEGRLVLGDVLTWVQRDSRPKTIIDLATLTGAIIVSLGFEHGGLFANDDELAQHLLAAGQATGEKLWRFPLSDAYDKLIDSPIADMKNVGPREGGSITAAQFIKRFVEKDVRWAHLDIAGMVWASKPGTLWDKGATGYGVRLLDRFVADHCE